MLTNKYERHQLDGIASVVHASIKTALSDVRNRVDEPSPKVDTADPTG